MEPDAIIEIRLKTTHEGGRKNAISIADRPFGCPLFVAGEAFDCRFLLENQRLELGRTYEIPIKFLCPETAIQKLSAGAAITLWEGKDIPIGKVIRLGK
jgi:hypothetical protein